MTGSDRRDQPVLIHTYNARLQTEGRPVNQPILIHRSFITILVYCSLLYWHEQMVKLKRIVIHWKSNLPLRKVEGKKIKMHKRLEDIAKIYRSKKLDSSFQKPELRACFMVLEHFLL